MVELTSTYADVTNVTGRLRAEEEARRARLSSVPVPPRSSRPLSSPPERYVVEERFRSGSNEKSYAEFRPVVVSETSDGYVVEEYETYTKWKNESVRDTGVYLKTKTVYDSDGNALTQERYRVVRDRSTPKGVTRRDVQQAGFSDYTKGESTYIPAKINYPEEQAAADAAKYSEKVYSVTNPATNNPLVSKNPEWLLAATGVDPRKVTPGTTVLREEGTGKVYYARKETLAGGETFVGIGETPPTGKLTAVKVGSATTPFVDDGKRPPTLTSDIITNVTTTKKPSPIADVDLSPAKGTRTDAAQYKFLTGQPLPELRETTIPRDSTYFSQQAITAAQMGRGDKEFSNIVKAAGTSVKELGGQFFDVEKVYGIPLIKLDPVGVGEFLASPALIATNPKSAFETIKENPYGTITQTALLAGGQSLLFRGFRAYQAEKIKSGVTEQLGRSETVGTGEFYPDTSGGFVQKRTSTKVKVGRNEYDVVIDTPLETFGSGSGILTAEEAATYTKLRPIVPDAQYGVSQGRYTFTIDKAGQPIVKGTGTTTGATLNLGEFDLYLRESSAKLTGKKEGTVFSQEFGALKEQLAVEGDVRIVDSSGLYAEPARVTQSLTEGVSTILVKDRFPVSKDVVIKANEISTKKYGEIFETEMSSGRTMKGGVQYEPPSAYELTGGAETPVNKFTFSSSERSATMNPQKKDFFEVNIDNQKVNVPTTYFDESSGLVSVQSSGLVSVQQSGTTLSKLQGAEKSIVADTITALETQGKQTVVIPFSLVTQVTPQSKQDTAFVSEMIVGEKTPPLTETFTEQPIKLSEETKPRYDVVEVSSYDYLSKINEETTTVNKINLVNDQTTKITPNTTLRQETNLLTLPRMAATTGFGNFAPPPTTPSTPFMPSRSANKPSFGSFVAEVRRRGVFRPVGVFGSAGEAGRVAAGIVRGTAAASFRVRQGLDAVKVPSFAGFGASKREKGVMVEKNVFRIDSPGERAEITMKGLFARKKGDRRWG